MAEASSMHERPPIRAIGYTTSEGNPAQFIVGRDSVLEIREVGELSEYAIIPWVEVWAQSRLLARFNQHKLDHIFYVPEGTK